MRKQPLRNLKRKPSPVAIVIGCVLVLVIVAATLAYLLLVTLMFVWNITDINENGANFWNVFWLVLASFMALGIVSGMFARKQ